MFGGLFLTSRLREDFDFALSYQEAYDGFRERAIRSGARFCNQLSGKADMARAGTPS